MKKCVIIGNSGAAINCILAIREHNLDPVLVISKEKCPAYSPMLIPYYVEGKIPYEAMFLCDYTFYQRNLVETRFGSAAVELEPNANKLYMEDGSHVYYDYLLIAAGSRPIVPSIPGSDLPSVYTVWTESDAQRIKKDLNNATRVVVVGAGAIGMHMMEIIHSMGKQVTIVEMASRVMSALLDVEGSEILERRMKDEGIGIHLGAKLLSIKETLGGKAVALDTGTMLEADMVIIATGVVPNVEVAKNYLNVGRGIVVDEYCRTSVPNIYAAGDATEMINPLTGNFQNNPTWINAVLQGRTAGTNMAGKRMSLPIHVRLNVFNVLGLSIASMGLIDRESEGHQRFVNREINYYYESLYFSNGERLIGAVLIGNVNSTGILAHMIEKGISCPYVRGNGTHTLFSIQAWLCSSIRSLRV